jgi:hypothetical protein
MGGAVMTETFEIELFGGHADGRTYTLADLPSHFNTVQVGIPAIYTAAVEPTTFGPPDITTYALEYNQTTGKPRQTPEGRHIYRHGPRPAEPAGLPHWVADAFPRAHSWVQLGPQRWRALEPLMRHVDYVLYVLMASKDGRSYCVGQRVDPATLAQLDRADVELEIFRELSYQCEDALLPLCVVPGCQERGRMLLHAAEDGRLAGKDWRRGDEIRLCHEHYHDVWKAAGCHDLEQLAEWLRPDAKLEPDWRDGVFEHHAYWSRPGCTLRLDETEAPWRKS